VACGLPADRPRGWSSISTTSILPRPRASGRGLRTPSLFISPKSPRRLGDPGKPRLPRPRLDESSSPIRRTRLIAGSQFGIPRRFPNVNIRAINPLPSSLLSCILECITISDRSLARPPRDATKNMWHEEFQEALLPHAPSSQGTVHPSINDPSMEHHENVYHRLLFSCDLFDQPQG